MVKEGRCSKEKCLARIFFLYLLVFCSTVNPSPLNPSLDCESISLYNYGIIAEGTLMNKAGSFQLGVTVYSVRWV